MDNLKQQVIMALQTVYDPEIPMNIYDLGLVYTLNINPHHEQNGQTEVFIQIRPTTPACPMTETLMQNVQDAVLAVPTVISVKMDLIFDPPWTKEDMSEVARLQLNLF